MNVENGLQYTKKEKECIAIKPFVLLLFSVEKAIEQKLMEQCMFASGEAAFFDSC
jgi:hypothetical protein